MSKLSADIPKDLSKMKPKVIGYFTLRQAITFAIGAIFGLAAYWFISRYIDKALATWVMIVVAAPPFAFGIYYKKYQLYLEEILFYYWESQYHRPKIRPYEMMKGYPENEYRQQDKKDQPAEN